LERFLTVAEVAALLRRSAETIRRRVAHGRYPGAFLDGREWRIPAADVEAEIAARRAHTVHSHSQSPALTKAQQVARRILSEVA